MRVLVDARIGWGHGIGRVIANTVPRVAALQSSWTFDALVNPEDLERANSAFERAPNLRLISTPIRPFSLPEQTHLAGYARGYDLTWFTNYWVPLAWRAPFVVTVHDLLHLMPDLAPATRLNRQIARQTFEKIRRQARAIMFDSRFTQSEFGRLVGEPRVGMTVPLGGDHLSLACDGDDRKQKILLAVAAPKRHKNFALLLEAWQDADVPPGWQLVLVAPSDPMRSTVDLDAMARDLGNVVVRRGISNGALAELFEQSAIVLTPSLYEGFGLPLLEGLLAGALCVSSTAGSLVEVAEGAFVQFVNGRDRVGWTAAIEKACETVETRSVDLASLRRHNRRCAGRYTWDRTAELVAEVLASAASGGA